jgi:hypothetical protein
MRSKSKDGLSDLQVSRPSPPVIVDMEANTKLEYDASSAMKADPHVRSVFLLDGNAMDTP